MICEEHFPLRCVLPLDSQRGDLTYFVRWRIVEYMSLNVQQRKTNFSTKKNLIAFSCSSGNYKYCHCRLIFYKYILKVALIYGPVYPLARACSKIAMFVVCLSVRKQFVIGVCFFDRLQISLSKSSVPEKFVVHDAIRS